MSKPALAAQVAKLKALAHAKADAIQGGDWLVSTPDSTYERFLQGHGLHVDTALSLMVDAAKWRKEFELDKLMDTWETDDSIEAVILRGYIPIGTVGVNRTGKPVIVNRLSAIDFTNLNAAVGMSNMLKHIVFLAEKHVRNNPTGNSTLVFDVSPEYMTVSTFNDVRQWITTFTLFVKKLSAIVDPYYPELYKEIIFCNAQKMFMVTWNVIKTFLAHHTVEKVKILSQDPLPTLLELMDLNVIPDFLDGHNDCSMIGIGGPLPNPLTTEFILSMKSAKKTANKHRSVMHPAKIDESIHHAVIEDTEAADKPGPDAPPGERCTLM